MERAFTQSESPPATCEILMEVGKLPTHVTVNVLTKSSGVMDVVGDPGFEGKLTEKASLDLGPPNRLSSQTSSVSVPGVSVAAEPEPLNPGGIVAVAAS